MSFHIVLVTGSVTIGWKIEHHINFACFNIKLCLTTTSQPGWHNLVGLRVFHARLYFKHQWKTRNPTCGRWNRLRIWRSNDDDRLVGDVDGLMLITGGPQGPRWIPGGQEGPDRRPIVDDVDGLMLITGGPQGPR